ncbi:MAG TPA: thiamine pyrophosphate-binding protein [Candidatus Udaeobacter sp.]|nr:thiamine pyrophosphate-binding protein [Candidatus Udaeobacter sp.]
MSAPQSRRTGGQVLIDQLLIHGVDMAFGVPGESYLAALDALYEARNRIRFITCRQEGGACNMAEAYGKLTGRPGICFVTRGPGTTNASIGLHTAYQDSTPLLLLIGQVARDQAEREAFQEVDYRRMLGPLTKWVAEIDDARRIPELVSQAFHRATSGRPGPVALALPEDMLTELVETADAGPYSPVQAYPAPADLERMATLLASAKRPLMIVGGGGWSKESAADITSFAEANSLPVGAAFRRQDIIDNLSPSYVGDVGIGINPKLADRVTGCDVLLVVGARLGEMTTGGYTLVDIPRPHQTLIHIHAGAEELGRVYQPALAINAGMAAFAGAARALPAVTAPAWRDWTAAARADYLAHIEVPRVPGPVQMGEIVAFMRKRLAPETILVNGAGNYSTWLHRFYTYRGFRTQLAPTSGAMGYGVPAAVAAKAVHPDRPVISWNGDGCFMMNGQELATAVQHGLAVVFVVVNNGMYGTIRMHQERHYPARTIGTDLVNPDFAALARAYGAQGETVTRTEEFAPALERALAAGKPALIEIRLDPEAITPRQTLSQIRASGLKAKGR